MNLRQRRFVEEFLIDPNGSRAARRAGYAAKSSSVEGSRLLGNAKVWRIIKEAQQARSERLQVTAAMVVAELALQAFGDFRDFFDEADDEGSCRLFEPTELTAEVAHRVQSVKFTVTIPAVCCRCRCRRRSQPRAVAIRIIRESRSYGEAAAMGVRLRDSGFGCWGSASARPGSVQCGSRGSGRGEDPGHRATYSGGFA